MNYKCKKCGAEFVLTNDIKVCKFCHEPIDFKAVNEKATQLTEDYIKVADDYRNSSNSTKIRRLIQNYKDSPDRELPNFDSVWRSFVMEVTGAAEEKNDVDLQTFIKNHAKQYDSEYNSDLFISILQAYPKVGNTSDWDDIINETYNNNAKFTGLCEHLIHYIIKTKARAFAIDIFYKLSAKEEKGVEAGKTYIRNLISSEEISNQVFTVSAFNRGRTKSFIKDVQKYCNKYLKKDNTVIIEETQVWNNYVSAIKKQKKRNIIIVIITVLVLAAAGLTAYLILHAINKNTIQFKIDKVVEAYYGDELELSGFNVTYNRNSGEAGTEQITTKMLKNYNPEKLGEQQVIVEFEGVQYQITIVVKEKKLAKPVVTQQGNRIAWDTVLNADSYSIYVNSATTPTATIKELSYDLSTNPNYGNLEITVRANPSAESKFKNSEMSDKLIIKKLEAPKGIKYEKGFLKWDSVEGAIKYEISVNNTPYNSTTNSLEIEFTDENIDVTITAIGDTNTINGTKSERISHYVLKNVSNMKYTNGTISFDSDERANVFKVYVDGEFWKEFSRNNFNVSTDGFLDTFTNDTHKIEIILASSSVGVEESSLFGYDVAIANHIRIEENSIKWDSVGTGATYDVVFNNENKKLSMPLITLNEITVNDGNNNISIEASINGKTIICETATIYKNLKPTIGYANGNWVLENDSKISYKYDDSDYSKTIIAVDDILEGSHKIEAKRDASTDSLEIESDSISISINRASAPIISASYGEITSTYDVSKYKLSLYYAQKDSTNFAPINDLDEILLAGEYNLKAKLSNASEDENVINLDSEYSNIIDVIKLDYPDVIYDEGDSRVTSSVTNVKFYYLLDDVETELVGGLVANLPGGVFSIYARRIPSAPNELISAPTPTNQRVTVFNMDISLSASKYASSQSQFYLTFDGCDDIDQLTFDYLFEYENASGVKIGSKTQTGIIQKKGTASPNKIIYLANYRLDVSFEPGYENKDIKKVLITVKIKTGSGDQTLTTTYNV